MLSVHRGCRLALWLVRGQLIPTRHDFEEIPSFPLPSDRILFVSGFLQFPYDQFRCGFLQLNLLGIC